MVAGSSEVCQKRFLLGNQTAPAFVDDARLVCIGMGDQGFIWGRVAVRRALTALACAALLYFAAGGVLLHQHAQGPDSACHICQALHMPALAAARVDLNNAAQLVTWYSSLPQHVAPSNTFALHRAGRAPPSA